MMERLSNDLQEECIWLFNYVIIHTHDIITIIPQNNA